MTSLPHLMVGRFFALWGNTPGMKYRQGHVDRVHTPTYFAWLRLSPTVVEETQNRR